MLLEVLAPACFRPQVSSERERQCLVPSAPSPLSMGQEQQLIVQAFLCRTSALHKGLFPEKSHNGDLLRLTREGL